VKKAHRALVILVAEGCSPIVIGKAGHVEVLGLTGDFPGAKVILCEDDIRHLDSQPRFGVVAQTTQPIEKVEKMLSLLKENQPHSEVRFRDTVCQPTKNRQKALHQLALEVDFMAERIRTTLTSSPKPLASSDAVPSVSPPRRRLIRLGSEIVRKWVSQREPRR